MSMSHKRLKKYPVRRTLERGRLGIGWRVRSAIVMRSGNQWETAGPFWFPTRARAESFAASGDSPQEIQDFMSDKVAA